MKDQYLHSLKTSFMLYLDHQILDQGLAYQNYSGNLYKINEWQDQQWDVYASPFRQWVSDASISGANIPYGITDASGNFIPGGGLSGVIIDYNNGRVKVQKGLLTDPTISASFALKELNIYMTSENEQQVLFDERHKKYPAFPIQVPNTGINMKMRPYPSMYLIGKRFNATPFEFGGTKNFKYTFRVLSLCDSDYLLDGVISIFQASKDKYFALFPNNLLPIDRNGDLKSGQFNYANVSHDLEQDGANLIYIERCDISTLAIEQEQRLNESLKVAVMDFDVSIPRLA